MITLRYENNVQRINVGNISPEELSRADDIEKYILEEYQKAGYTAADDPTKLHIKHPSGEIEPLCRAEAPEDNDTVLYVDIIAPDNAKEFERKDGIKFFFHTSEEGHLNNPHIHAEYSGDEISIYFSDLRVDGEMKSPKVQRKAIEYVKANLAQMRASWDKIINK